MARGRIRPAADGGVRLRLTRRERALLERLPGELRALLASDPDDPALRRLFPPAYEDETEEAEYRSLARDDLLAGRREALRVLETTAGRESLSANEADSWLRALNDLRLVVGTRLDVSEDTLLSGVLPHGRDAREAAVYVYLSWLQEQLVQALAKPETDPSGS